MKLSIGYGFQKGLIESLSKYPAVKEIYGKMHKDVFGGGRWSCTLQHAGSSALKAAVKKAHEYNISFNYLLNGADLNGLEQTIHGQKTIRHFLDFLSDLKIDSVTVTSPYLLRLIKKQYPELKIRISAFAMISSANEAVQWEQLGADILVISAIACNRNFGVLSAIRESVNCELELIANAACLQNCIFEKDHMNLLSRGSRSTDPLKGFQIDYCFLHCSYKRLRDPVNFIKACWIRPEDIALYEKLGYTNFKIVERSSPAEMILKRVSAYSQGHFDGNLYELIAPVAQISKQHGASNEMKLRLLTTMFRPDKIKLSSLSSIFKYSQLILNSGYPSKEPPVHIDNSRLDGFLSHIKEKCNGFCKSCTYCENIAKNVIRINDNYKKTCLTLAEKLDNGSVDSTHWLPPNKRSFYERSHCK